MENWSTSIGCCRSTPSSCAATTFSHENPLTVLAVGTPYLYILDCYQKKCLAVVKFSASVVHVSMLYSVKELETSTVVCSLEDGMISVFNIASILQNSTSREVSPFASLDDMFEDLFGGGSSKSTKLSVTNADGAIDGNQISMGIGMCPGTSSWKLRAASICNDHLILSRQSKETESIAFVVLQSSKPVQLSAGSSNVSVPSFVCNHQILSLVVDPGRNVLSTKPASRTRTMHVNPVFTVVQSAKSTWSRCSSMDDKLFCALFGPELSFVGAPVMVIGTQNGKIYFTNFRRSIGKAQEVEGILGPLYDLEQPVVGLHLTYFVPRTVSNDDDDCLAAAWDTGNEQVEEKEGIPNALVFVGQRGKVTICYINSNVKKCSHDVVEFQFPGPVLSSVLVPRQCLLFATLHGIYRVCLSKDCAKCIEEKLPNFSGHSCSLRIPYASFSFPEKLLSTCCPSYILKTRTSDEYHLHHSQLGDDPVACSCISVDGSIGDVVLRGHAERQVPATGRKVTADEVGRDMKQCLDSIQVVTNKISQARSNIESLNSSLTEIKSNLGLLCAVADTCCTTCGALHSCIPFKCSFTCAQECAGMKVKKLYVDVCMKYSKIGTTTADLPHRLGPGWYLVVEAFSLHRQSRSSSSKSISISGLEADGSVTLRIEVDFEGLQVLGILRCFIYHTPRQLCGAANMKDNIMTKLSKFHGVSLHLCTKVITMLDFAKWCKQLLPGGFDESLSLHKRKNASQSLSSGTSSLQTNPSHTTLTHYIDLPISSQRAVETILKNTSAIPRDDLFKLSSKSLGSHLLLSLLSPAQHGMTGDGLSKGKAVLSILNGPGVSVEVRDQGSQDTSTMTEPIQLHLRSVSKQTLVAVAAAVHAVLIHHGSYSSTPAATSGAIGESSEQLREVLEGLRSIAKDAGSLREQASSAHQQLNRNCLSVNAYKSKMKSIKMVTFAVFCRLRELNGI